MSFRDEIEERFGIVYKDEDILSEDENSFTFQCYDKLGNPTAIGGWNRNTVTFWRNCRGEDK